MHAEEPEKHGEPEKNNDLAFTSSVARAMKNLFMHAHLGDSSLFESLYYVISKLRFYNGRDLSLLKAKAAFSNSFTIFPLLKVPRSPPRFFEGHRETCLAMFANFSPFFSRSKTVLASFSVFTRMWAQ
jgi:hypothetical protein